MIKRISMMLIVVMFGFCFVNTVKAEEADLSSVVSLASEIGGAEEEISPIVEGTFKYYYKIQAIDDSDFATYVSSRYIVDNGDDSTDEYAEAQTRVTEYEETFKGLIPTLNTTADLNGWTESTDKQIKPTNLKYEENKHHGYVLAVVAVKDQTIYATRLILESKNTTILSDIEYNENDKSSYTNNTQSVVEEEDTQTKSNPETGIEDCAIYLVPIAIILGSGILLRRNYA